MFREFCSKLIDQNSVVSCPFFSWNCVVQTFFRYFYRTGKFLHVPIDWCVIGGEKICHWAFEYVGILFVEEVKFSLRKIREVIRFNELWVKNLIIFHYHLLPTFVFFSINLFSVIKFKFTTKSSKYIWRLQQNLVF